MNFLFKTCLLILLFFCQLAWAENSVDGVTTLTQAELFSLTGQRSVTLPHMLESSDFNPAGGRVTYRLTVNLAEVPKQRLGIYVRKLGLSGNVHLNGQWAGTCEYGELEQVRCLHKPFMVVPTPTLWRQGMNTIDLEVYADRYQNNGLAPITIGAADALDAGPMRWQQF